MSKRILLTLIGCLCMEFCFSQTLFNTEKVDTTNVYRHALSIYCQSVDKTKLQNNIVYVEYDYLFTDKLPQALNGIKIKYVQEKELRKAIKSNSGHTTLVRIIPLRVNGNDFFVNVIPFFATYKKKNFDLKNGGGLGVHYKFDPHLKGLVYIKSEWGGI